MQSAQTSTDGNLLFFSFGLNSLDPYVLTLGLSKINMDGVDQLSILEPAGGSQGLQNLGMGDQAHSLLGLLVVLEKGLSESQISLQEPVNFFELSVLAYVAQDFILMVTFSKIGLASVLHVPVLILKLVGIGLSSKLG